MGVRRMTALVWVTVDGHFTGIGGRPQPVASETLNGGMVYRRTEEKPYVRVDGAISVLDEWTADCRNCGVPFTFWRARGCFPVWPNRTCPKCH